MLQGSRKGEEMIEEKEWEKTEREVRNKRKTEGEEETRIAELFEFRIFHLKSWSENRSLQLLVHIDPILILIINPIQTDEKFLSGDQWTDLTYWSLCCLWASQQSLHLHSCVAAVTVTGAGVHSHGDTVGVDGSDSSVAQLFLFLMVLVHHCLSVSHRWLQQCQGSCFIKHVAGLVFCEHRDIWEPVNWRPVAEWTLHLSVWDYTCNPSVVSATPLWRPVGSITSSCWDGRLSNFCVVLDPSLESLHHLRDEKTCVFTFKTKG